MGNNENMSNLTADKVCLNRNLMSLTQTWLDKTLLTERFLVSSFITETSELVT